MRIRLNILLISVILSVSASWSQKVHLKTLANLPKNIFESSGITANRDGTLWTHNDSGDGPVIYKIDTLGHLLKTLYLQGATAIDYEEISQDNQGNVYVCDCGNNANRRQNLCIYKIPHTAIASGSDTVIPEIIHFSFSDQYQFPPPKEKQNFDCEAFVVFNDSIFLFSKNGGESQYCKRYGLPNVPGVHTAILLDSTITKRWVTGAALSPDNKTLILLSENKLNIFNHFKGSDFFGGQHTKTGIPVTLKEGITFKNNTSIYLTDEKYKWFGGKLYYIDLGHLIK
ncbi:MAG: hypothetical protein HYU69_10140 [Bacteroidetes bacterium]|nr:hypothetical protein [Bacteroidota bacterium]